jgi:hypothetical protein
MYFFNKIYFVGIMKNTQKRLIYNSRSLCLQNYKIYTTGV